MTFIIFRVVVAVLDNFHFDLSSLRSVVDVDEEKNDDITTATPSGPSHSGEEQIPDDKVVETPTAKLEGHEGHEGHKGHEGMETEDKSEETQEVKEVSTGKEEESSRERMLAKKIHKAIVSSILPSLEAVLTKRVSQCTRF